VRPQHTLGVDHDAGGVVQAATQSTATESTATLAHAATHAATLAHATTHATTLAHAATAHASTQLCVEQPRRASDQQQDAGRHDPHGAAANPETVTEKAGHANVPY
jgi:hypothetical protein